MALWKRGRRYWTRFTVNGVLFRKPLCPPASHHATTKWQEAVRLEKDVIRSAVDGRLDPQTGPTRFFDACEAYIAAKRATANTERTVAFDCERLDVAKRHFGDIKLTAFSRELIEGFQQACRCEQPHDQHGHRRLAAGAQAVQAVAAS